MTGIYKITNKINKKIYIGKAINITTRWNQHYLDSFNDNINDNSIIHKAIRKYGVESFSFEILILCSPKELDELEKYYIKYYNSNNKDIGYNIAEGGGGAALKGEQNHNSKLSNDDVYQIREAYKNLCHKSDVYECYKDIISINTFGDVWTGKTWKDVHYDVYTEECKEKHKKLKKPCYHPSVLTEEEVMFIRDCKNSGAQRLEIHEKYFKHININTFSDVWAEHTFKHIQSSLPIVKQKRYRTMNQDGALNRMAKFTEEEIISIRKRRDSGENKECVYMDYSDRVLKQTFDNIWDNKTYKNI